MILITLGSNLNSLFGSPAQTIAAAQQRLTALGVRTVHMSRLWHSAPVPASSQPWFVNAVMEAQCEQGPLALLYLLQSVEAQFGREREKRNAARTLDLDLPMYDEYALDCSFLQLPHPRMQERGFVLYPLRDIVPDWRDPRTG